MEYDNSVSEHYRHGNLLLAIEDAIGKLGKRPDDLSIDDLAPVDEFHIGGRVATENFLSQLNFTQHDHILDIGCGLGGAARYVANTYRTRVTGIDLTPEYIDTGQVLCRWVKLDSQISLHQGSALGMPFTEETFDGAYMLHVGMNIEEKTRLFTEVYRVLRPGGAFGVYDVMRTGAGELRYPVPWAADDRTSKLATPADYAQALVDAGFEVVKTMNQREFALDFFSKLKAKTQAEGGPPPLGLHTLMKETTITKIGNMIDNIADEIIAPVEIIARKAA